MTRVAQEMLALLEFAGEPVPLESLREAVPCSAGSWDIAKKIILSHPDVIRSGENVAWRRGAASPARVFDQNNTMPGAERASTHKDLANMLISWMVQHPDTPMTPQEIMEEFGIQVHIWRKVIPLLLKDPRVVVYGKKTGRQRRYGVSK